MIDGSVEVKQRVRTQSDGCYCGVIQRPVLMRLIHTHTRRIRYETHAIKDRTGHPVQNVVLSTLRSNTSAGRLQHFQITVYNIIT